MNENFVCNDYNLQKRGCLPVSWIIFQCLVSSYIVFYLSLSIFFFLFFTVFIWVNSWRNKDNNIIDPLYCVLVTPPIVECSLIMNRRRRGRKQDKCVNILITPNKNSFVCVYQLELEILFGNEYIVKYMYYLLIPEYI